MTMSLRARAKRGDKQHAIVQGAASLSWDYEPSEFAALLRERYGSIAAFVVHHGYGPDRPVPKRG